MGTAKKKPFIHRLPRHFYLSLFLIVAGLIVFAQSYRFEFLNYDDGINVYDNPHVKQSEFSYFLKGQHLGLYIPLTYELWALQARFAKVSTAQSGGLGISPQLFHLSNIVAHLLSILMVFFILRILIKNDWAAWAGALLFGLHPVQVETVAWITGFKNVLSGLLALASIWQYLSYAARDPSLKTKGRSPDIHYIAAVILFILAILSMPMAIVTPVVAGMLSFWMLKRSFRQCLAELIPCALLALPIMVLTKISQPDLKMEFVAPLWQRPLVAGDAVTFYISKLIWPVSLGPDYGRSPAFVLQHNWIYLTGLVPYFLGALLVWKWRRPWLMSSLGVFVVGVLPVLGFVAFVFQDMSTVADRYLYLAMLGPALALAWFLSARGRWWKVLVFGVVIAMFGLCSIRQIGHWKNSASIFEHALKVNPLSWLANNNLGIVLEKQDQVGEAVACYEEALRLKPNFAEAHLNLGMALQREGKTEAAAAHYRKALDLDPNFVEAHSNLAAALQEMGQIEGAVSHCFEAIRLNPGYPEARFNLGNILRLQGKLEEAAASYGEALRIDPNYAEAHNNLGITLQKQGKVQEAAAHYREALELRPDYAGAHMNLGNVLQQEGKLEEAIAHYQEALRINPALAEAHSNMGLALQKQGKTAEAVMHYNEALKINPDLEPARFNLGQALREMETQR